MGDSFNWMLSDVEKAIQVLRKNQLQFFPHQGSYFDQAPFFFLKIGVIGFPEHLQLEKAQTV